MRGRLQVYLSPDPAAGQEIVYPITSQVVVRVLAITLTFVTDATVATRRVRLAFFREEQEVFRAGSTAGQAASLTSIYTAGPGIGPNAGSDTIPNYLSLPVDLLLDANCEIRTTTAALQAGDNYGPLAMLVEVLDDAP